MRQRLVALLVTFSLGTTALAEERAAAPPAALAELAPSNGRASTVAGSILLGLGSVALIGSAVVWGMGGARNPMAFAFAATIDVFGGALFVPGAVLLPLGLVRASRRRAWDRAHGVASGWAPIAAPTPSGGLLGLRVQF